MSFTSIIPFDINERIVDLLAEDEDDKDYSALKACSLVCRTFIPICRKHIFAEIVLNDDSSPTTPQLERLLSKSPEIADYIRKLTYNIGVDDFTNPSIQQCLKRISRLQYLTVWHHHHSLDWRNNELRPVLLHLLHLPTLTNFQIVGNSKFIVSDLTPCVNLKKLVICKNTTVLLTDTFPASLPDHPIRLNELIVGVRNEKAIMNMLMAQRPDGQPVIDFSSLVKISLNIDNDSDADGSQEMCRRCKKLTDVYIYFPNPQRTCPSFSKMLQPSMQTLKHLDITTRAYDLNADPLAGIPSELEHMRTKNVIEKIVVKVAVQTYLGCRQGDDWGRLDEVLTRSGWSALRQVSLTILVDIDDWGSGESESELEVSLRNLIDTQFLRLSTSKSISFKFEVDSGSSCCKD